MEEVSLLRHVSRYCGSSCRSGASLPLWGRSFALGQLISFLIAGTGVSSSFLVEWGVSVPTTQSALNYALLLFTYLGYRGVTRGWWSLTRLRLPWWKYALLGALDVEANFLIGECPCFSSSLRMGTLMRPYPPVLAYRYTSITSVMLIDCWTIPCVMALSWWFFGARFQVRSSVKMLCCCVVAPPRVRPSVCGSGGTFSAWASASQAWQCL